MKIVITPDSFKGSLTSAEVARAMAEGVKRVINDAEIVCLPAADGGEGSLNAIAQAMHAEWRECRVHDPLSHLVWAKYAIVKINGIATAIIEMAQASGITLVKSKNRDVMHASSFGTGEMIMHAYGQGCRRFIIAIGGSATCDAGIGMLHSLGVRFLDGGDREILNPTPADFEKIEYVDASCANRCVMDCDFIVVSDVENPLYGEHGAAKIFSPQKGASEAQAQWLDQAIYRLSEIVTRRYGKDYASAPGSGAAGGIGWAFMSFFNARIKAGGDAILDILQFERHLEGAEMVITGEGCIDCQTLYGKLPYRVCQRATLAGVPTIAISGVAKDIPMLISGGFAAVYSISGMAESGGDSMRPEIAKANVAALASDIIRGLE